MYKHTYSLLGNRLLSAGRKNTEYSRGEIGFAYMKLLMLADYQSWDTGTGVSTYTGNKNKTWKENKNKTNIKPNKTWSQTTKPVNQKKIT